MADGPRRNQRFEHAKLVDPATGGPAVCIVTRVHGTKVQYRNTADAALYSRDRLVFDRVVGRWLTDEETPR